VNASRPFLPPRGGHIQRQAEPPADLPARPPDLRLVPAAAAVWVVVLVGLGAGPGVAAVATAVAAIALLIAWGRRGRATAAVVAATGCAVAAGLVVTAHTLAAHEHPLRAAAERGAAATLWVVVRDDPRALRSTTAAGRPGATQVVVPATLLAAETGGGRWSGSGRVLLIAPGQGWTALLPGQRLVVEGLLAPATRVDLTVAVLRVRSAPRDVGPPPWWQNGTGALRDGLRRAAGVLPDGASGLLPGLAVGDTRGMADEVVDDFRAAGLAHLTAVSGANLAIVAGAVLGLLRLLRADPRLAAACGAAAVLGFVLLARPSPSVLRAAVMGGVVLLALALGRGRSAVPALAAAVLGLLLADPALASDPGFALSVLATAALVLVAPGWAAGLRRRGVPAGAAEALVVPAAACVATAPLVAGLSGTVSLVTVAANLLAVPAVAPATVLGVVAALLSAVWMPAAQACAWLAGPAVGWLVAVADRAAAVPGGVVPWPDGMTGAALLVVVVLTLHLLARSRRLRPLLLAVAVGLLLVLVPTRVVRPGWPPAGWAIVACDVGQGDALVLATGQPGRAVLVDAGPADGPVDACLDRLGVTALALVLVSHPHADHVGGLAGALRDRAVGAVAVGPVREPRWALERVRRQAAAAGAQVVQLEAGTRLGWTGLSLEVLGPQHPPGYVDPDDGTAVNDGSLVLRATTPAGTVLLSGDVEVAAQAQLLAAGAPVRADVLKMPHHGSRYQSPEFLAAVAPRAVLVSVGAGNSYRHPDVSLLGRLERAGATVRRTDVSGDVAVTVERGGGPSDAPGRGLELVSRGDPLPAPRRRRPSSGVRAGRRSVGERVISGVTTTLTTRSGPSSGVAGGEGRAHRLAARRDGGGGAQATRDRVEGLEPVTSDHQDGLGVGVELPGLDELLRGGDGDPPGGLGEHPLGAGQQPDALHDLLVRDVGDGATRAAHGVEHVRTVGGVADRERPGDRVGPHRLHHVVAVGERLRHRRAARRLRPEHPVRGGLHEAQLAQLMEALVDLGQLRAGRHGHHHLAWQPPTELLGDLEAQRLGALGVVRAHVDVDERPVFVLGGQLGRQPVDVVVVAVHGQQRAAVDGGGEDLGLLQRRRDHHDRVPPRAGGGRRHGVGEIAGRRAGEHPEAQLAGGRKGDRDHAVLERVRRVARVVLDPQRAHAQRRCQAVGLDQPGQAGLGVGVALDVRRYGEQLPVAPDRTGPGLDRLAGHVGEVVGDLERSEALGTGELGSERDLVAALATRQRAGRAEVEGGRRAGGRRGSQGHRKISSSSPLARVGIGTVIARARCSRDAGCRGFNGPVPLPLWMSHMWLWSLPGARSRAPPVGCRRRYGTRRGASSCGRRSARRFTSAQPDARRWRR
jgi:DNA internalization-related competence protein ComEC/Rec2